MSFSREQVINIRIEHRAEQLAEHFGIYAPGETEYRRARAQIEREIAAEREHANQPKET